MAIKVSHTNKKNTSFPVQILLSEDGTQVNTLNMVPDGFFYSKIEFLTSSMRVLAQRQLLKIEEGIEKPEHLSYGVVYAPSIPVEKNKLEPITDIEYFQENLRRALKIPHDENNQIRDEVQIVPEPTVKDTATKVKEYKEQKEEPIEEKSEVKVEEQTEEQTEQQSDELKSGRWEDDEEKYLKRNYPKHGAKYVAKKLNRAEKSVSKKAESMGVKKRKS